MDKCSIIGNMTEDFCCHNCSKYVEGELCENLIIEEKCEFFNNCTEKKEKSLLCISKLKYACSVYHWKKTKVIK